ncbi:MAG TPA: ParB/RepB/Spo0J family partition protein [Flavobacteriales bacterium]|nr:ParB/RepB/Spo0J family partition protein [Flavobacteriales bacterium]HIA11465.1 ParB/RepB/Spo0J family partition protein [Flavobacteriales bacterium]HIB00953.1 ParB/RepB/Spo0J family partition protein [Phycisphaerales bacterium]HIO71912.1 ParB/RepB/Spo0J family partition protein [Flavobacteriales bacterium]
MAAKRNALGKGLSALLENYDTDVTSKPEVDTSGVAHADKVVGSIANLPLSSIDANPFQPRTKFDAEALNDLANSIKEHNLIQPITVRKMGYEKYQIISGERRLKACKLAGLAEVPCYIRIANDQQMLEMALVENIQREQLNPIEISISFKRLTEEVGLSQDELSEKVGKNRATISNYLRLLKLPSEVQIGLRDQLIQMGHARAIINIEDESVQLGIYKKTVKNGLSVRQVEELVRSIDRKEGSIEKQAPHMLSNEHKKLNYRLSTHFDTEVVVSGYNNKKGKIVIPYSSEEDLTRILDVLDID